MAISRVESPLWPAGFRVTRSARAPQYANLTTLTCANLPYRKCERREENEPVGLVGDEEKGMTISIWHWLIIVVFVVVSSIPIYAMNFERMKEMKRNQYSLKFVVLFIAGGLTQYLITESGTPLFLLKWLILLILSFLTVYIVVRRLKDWGKSKYLAWLCFVPLVNLLFQIVLCFPSCKKNAEIEESVSV